MPLLHTDRDYEQELGRLRQSVLLMGARVENMIGRALKAFQVRDIALAAETIDLDLEVDQLEIDIDRACIRILARRQPVASDLRFITTALKIVTDLERIGDLATNVCERVRELDDVKLPAVRACIVEMGEAAHDMVREALDAFIAGDDGRAVRVLERDNHVDAIYARLFPALLEQMTPDESSVLSAQRLQSVGKYLERIADHATNIAEMVVFMVRGEDLRHARKLAGHA
jgi:phosphate transport system protein